MQIERARVPQPESNQRDASEDGDEDDEGEEGDKRRKGKRCIFLTSEKG